MSLDFAELAYFIDQLTRAAEFYGFSKADTQALNTRMNSLYNSRCAPPITFNAQQGPQLLSLCQDPSCPLAVPNSDCEAYTNLSADGGRGASGTDTATFPADSTSETASNSTSPPPESSHKLGAGDITGVTIGSIAGVCLIAAALLFLRRHRNALRSKPQTEQHWTGRETVNYLSPQSDKFTRSSPHTLYSPAELYSPKSPAPVELSGETNGAENERISRAL